MPDVVRRRCDGCGNDIGIRQRTGQLAPHFPCSASRRSGPEPLTPYERVMRHVRKARGGHLLWTGTVHKPTGYPMIRTGSRVRPGGMRAKNESCRRVVWEHHHGPVPKHTQVRSTCGRPLCLAIEHMHAELPKDARV